MWQSEKGLCSDGSQLHGTPACLLGAVQTKTNGRGMDEIIENINGPFFKAVVNPVCNLLTSSQKWYSRAERGREKSSRGNRHELKATSGGYFGEGLFNKWHDFCALPTHPRCPLLDRKCRVKWTSGLAKDSNSCIVLWFLIKSYFWSPCEFIYFTMTNIWWSSVIPGDAALLFSEVKV